MDTLHVWHNGYDWIVANNEQDARNIYHEYSLGGTCDGTDGCDCVNDGWTMWADKKPLKIVEDNDIYKFEEKTCREWADQHGRGFLCSTES